MAPERVGTVVVGGGIVGCAVAYYLAETGERDLLLVEASELGSGSTGGSFGGVRQQFSTPLEIELSRRGLEFWKTAEREFEAPVPFHRTGYLLLTGRPDIMTRLAAAADLQRSMGLAGVHVLDPRQIHDVAPWLSAEGLVGATHSPGDGRVTPTDGVAALAGAARRLGAQIREQWQVRALARVPGGWCVSGPADVEAARVVLCTGYWTTDLVRPFGLELGIRPNPLYSAITAPALRDQPVPLTIDLDTGFMVEREADALVICLLLEENPPGYGHQEMLELFAETARVRAPVLADVRVARHVVTSVDLGGDGHPYVGEVDAGLWMAAGFGGHGVMHGPPVGRLLARTIAGTPDPTLDIGALTPWRDPDAGGEWMVATRKG